MDLLYYREHKSCTNYYSEFSSGFSIHKFDADSKILFLLAKEFGVIFLKKGSLKIIDKVSNEVEHLKNNEMILLTRYETFDASVMENSEFVILFFDHPKILCDKFALQVIREECNKENRMKKMRVLPIKDQVLWFLESMDFYLKNKMYCMHLHDIKQSEFFFLMRAFYPKKENNYFFEPVAESLDDFINMVKNNFQKVDSVKDLASICNMSVKTFTRRFKENFNDSPKQWMMKEKAKFKKLTPMPKTTRIIT